MSEVAIIRHAFHSTSHVGTMVDVGAHAGGSSKPFLKDGWRVVAIEPDARWHDQLVKCQNNSHGRFTFLPVACGDKVMRGAPFYTSAVSSGISSLSAFHPSHTQSTTVDVVTLNEVVRQFELENIDFLKVDAEGYDLFVLRGLDWTLSAPPVVLCEFEDRKTAPLGYTYDMIIEFLEQRGYAVLISEWEPIREYGQRHTWHGVKENPNALASCEAWGNLIAVQMQSPFASMYDRIRQALHEYADTPGQR